MGEARVERYTHRAGGKRDHRHRSLGSVRHHCRDPVSSAHTNAPQPANDIACLHPQRAICHREAPGGQNGVAVGRVSSIVGEKVLEARKGTSSGAFARGFMLQLLDDLRQACPLCVRSFSSVEVYHAVYPPCFCTELGHLRLVISQSKLVSENSTITSRLLAAPIGSGALRQAVPSDRDRNGSGARRAGHREADVVVAGVIRAPPTLTRRHPNESIKLHERGKRGRQGAVSGRRPSTDASSASALAEQMVS